MKRLLLIAVATLTLSTALACESAPPSTAYRTSTVTVTQTPHNTEANDLLQFAEEGSDLQYQMHMAFLDLIHVSSDVTYSKYSSASALRTELTKISSWIVDNVESPLKWLYAPASAVKTKSSLLEQYDILFRGSEYLYAAAICLDTGDSADAVRMGNAAFSILNNEFRTSEKKNQQELIDLRLRAEKELGLR